MTAVFETLSTVKIINANRALAEIKLGKLAKRAKKYGQDITWEYSNTFLEEVDIGDSYERHMIKVKYVNIIISGEAPRHGDYEFLGRIDNYKGDALVMMRPDVDCPYDQNEIDPQLCTHCNHNRYRRQTYIVRDRNDGTVHQVGSTCLRDYMGCDNPEKAVWTLGFMIDVNEQFSDERVASNGIACYDVLRILELAAYFTRTQGYTSKAAADMNERLSPTSSSVINTLTARAGSSLAEANKITKSINDADRVMAKRTLEWVRGAEASSDYMRSLYTIMKHDNVEGTRYIGIVTSAVFAFQKANSLLEERAKSSNEHMGTVGDRIRGVVVKVTSKSGYDGRFGHVMIIRMMTSDGHRLTWFNSGSTVLDYDVEYTVDLTVKKHDEYEGKLTTMVNRVSVKSSKSLMETANV